MQTSTSVLNAHLKALDAADRYVSGTVAWNDNQRGVVNGQVSCWGKNITDARIVAEDGGHLPFVRPPNMDETLGVVDATDILLADEDGKTVDLGTVLESVQSRAEYMGYTAVDAGYDRNDPRKKKVVVRVQTCWVPLGAEQESRKVAPAHYSYQTLSRSDPRNLLLVGTPQGIHVHSDEAGINTLHGHSRSEDGKVNTHWFEAEPTDTQVGHAAHDDDAPSDAKRARAVEMGVRGMGPRTNCFVTISIPNKQAPAPTRSAGLSLSSYPKDDDAPPVFRSLGADVGESSAARMSLSEDVHGQAEANPIAIARDDTEPIVVTILTYNVVKAQSVSTTSTQVSPVDVGLAVADLDRTYKLLGKRGAVCKMSELPAILHKLTPEHMARIREVQNATVDPFAPTPNAVAMVG